MKTTSKIDQRLKEIPDSMQATYKKAISGASKAAAIKAMCQQCMGWEDVAKYVRECSSITCPLHAYRPYQSKTTDEE